MSKLEGGEGGLVPIALVAVTVKEKGLVQKLGEEDEGEDDNTSQVRESLLLQWKLVSCTDVTVYPVIAAPPLLEGALQETEKYLAITFVGDPGAVAAFIETGHKPTPQLKAMLTRNAFLNRPILNLPCDLRLPFFHFLRTKPPKKTFENVERPFGKAF